MYVAVEKIVVLLVDLFSTYVVEFNVSPTVTV